MYRLWESGAEQAFKAGNDQNLEGIYDFSSGKKGARERPCWAWDCVKSVGRNELPGSQTEA